MTRPLHHFVAKAHRFVVRLTSDIYASVACDRPKPFGIRLEISACVMGIRFEDRIAAEDIFRPPKAVALINDDAQTECGLAGWNHQPMDPQDVDARKDGRRPAFGSRWTVLAPDYAFFLVSDPGRDDLSNPHQSFPGLPFRTAQKLIRTRL